MESIEYKIQAENGFAMVTSTAGARKPRVGDMVTFTSNSAATTIQFIETSPFADLAAGETLTIGADGQGPFEIVYAGDHHCDCGELVNGIFSKWGGSGLKTPVEN